MNTEKQTYLNKELQKTQIILEKIQTVIVSLSWTNLQLRIFTMIITFYTFFD